MKGTKGHRDRKNGASREQWEKQKAARNAERGKQVRNSGQWVRE